ncbi:MAG: UDP-N-acetylglucosamine 1-carboxyvinyltransferase [Clostridia bacterium]|nr:UDP-N-acetylglucosamine 1-carboxyvinyltransferase [Clostridia bacterium]
MPKLRIEGGNSLCGVIDIQGAKNSILPIMAATLVADGECIIENCPDISDTHTALEILRTLGALVKHRGRTVYVDCRNVIDYEIPDALMRKMRSSVIFLGALLTRHRKAVISFPGGCELGPRPIDLHLSALEKMGVTIREEFGSLYCTCPRLVGCEIPLSFPSVGATENIMLAAVRAKGVTVITNAAREPEIEDLQNFLNEMGADVCGAGSSTVIVRGVDSLAGCSHRVIPDRIVTATYLCAVAATRGNALLRKTCPRHNAALLSALRQCGCEIEAQEDYLRIACDALFSARRIRTMPYPGFPTDAQAPFMGLMCVAKGSTVFVETIFENRYKHISELQRMGARITPEGRVAVVEGVPRLHGASVCATDLRGGAALMIAALAADGISEITDIYHIDRGYERPEWVLSQLGARISRIE